MTIYAADRSGVARLAIELAISMDVVEEMAITALHSAGEMNVLQMNRLIKFMRVIVGNGMIVEIEQSSFAIVLEDGAKDPAMAMVISKLGVLKFWIQLRDLGGKVAIAPKPAGRRRLGVFHGRDQQLVIGRVMLQLRIHELTVCFLVPPGITEKGIHKEVTLVHVAVHALTRWNRAGELVNDRMARVRFSE